MDMNELGTTQFNGAKYMAQDPMAGLCIFGTSGDDTILGTKFDDIILGFAGRVDSNRIKGDPARNRIYMNVRVCGQALACG